jgi:hypothetical protein
MERSVARQSPRRESPSPSMRSARPTGGRRLPFFVSSPLVLSLGRFIIPSSPSAYHWQTKIWLTRRRTTTCQLRRWHRRPQELHRSLISSPYSSIQQPILPFYMSSTSPASSPSGSGDQLCASASVFIQLHLEIGVPIFFFFTDADCSIVLFKLSRHR